MQGLLELSEEQLQDLEMLRRIYLIKRAGLAKERKMLVHQAVRSLSHAEDTVPLPGHTRVSSRSAFLHPHSHIQTDLCRITDLASLLVRVNADHVQGALRVSSHGWVWTHLSSAARLLQSRDHTEVFMLTYMLLLQCCNVRALQGCCANATRLCCSAWLSVPSILHMVANCLILQAVMRNHNGPASSSPIIQTHPNPTT